MKGKQDAAARKYAAVLEERERARSAFVAAERAAAEAEADAAHRRAEVESSQVGGSCGSRPWVVGRQAAALPHVRPDGQQMMGSSLPTS